MAGEALEPVPDASSTTNRALPPRKAGFVLERQASEGGRTACGRPGRGLWYLAPPMGTAEKRKRPARKTAGKKSAPPAPPRDWLAEYGAKANLDEAALRSVRAWLAEQLVADEFAKLGQGGHTETQVPLRRVFVDLPITDWSNGEMAPGSSEELFLKHLLAAAPMELQSSDNTGDPAVRGIGPRSRVTSTGIGGRSSWQPGSWSNAGTLLIGGPGQGKSTLGQLACQLHRAALLRARSAELPGNVRDVLGQFEASDLQAEVDEGPAPPEQPLLPIRVVLPDLATWLAGKGEDAGPAADVPRLLRWIISQPSARKGKLEAGTLSALVAVMPFLLLLDGFDEIGAAEDRERTVAVIREMLTALGGKDAHAVIVATTRPQGYAGELSRIGVPLAPRYLAYLSTEGALRYAAKLVQAKIQGADDRQKAMEKLRAAALEPATSRLLQTPLQVTILAALVQQQGRVPSERWRLFSSYFDFTYKREIERDTYASALLANRQPHILAIHARAALLLQVEAENAGGAAARMTRERLESIADEVLKEDEIAEEERKDLVRKIVDAAEKRLVFLVEPEPGEFGFEIRSLQEFMAAWALSSGRDSAVENRLQQIAKAPLFRNVLLFLASRFFSERSPLRDVLAGRICAALDEDPSDALVRITKAGALLALEVLKEGSALGQPKRARALMERAIGLLELPPGSGQTDLARVATADTEVVLREALEAKLDQGAGELAAATFGTWVCLVEATNLGHEWAIRLGERFWPSLKQPVRLLDVCEAVDLDIGAWLSSKLASATDTSLLNRSLPAEDKFHVTDETGDFIHDRWPSFTDRSASALLKELTAQSKGKPAVWADFFSWLIVSPGCIDPVTDSFLAQAYAFLGPAHPSAWLAIRAMRVALQSRRSGLDSPATWDRLELPLPYPISPLSLSRRTALPEKPVVLQELHVLQLRVLGDIKLPFEPPPPDKGQWIVFLGPNGAGKSTLLRSLVLALRNLSDPKIWPKGAFDSPWLATDGAGEAKITVRLADHPDQSTRIRANGSESYFQTPKQDEPRLFPLFAYGCRRGSALGGAARAVDLGDDDGPEVATLFHEGAPLIHAETWLIPWHGEALENPQKKAVYDAIRAALQAILDVTSIEVRGQKLWVTERSGRTLEFRSLSDGYLTTAGWFLDLVARWIALAERHKVAIDASFMERMTGLVLLDEIDLHLHPRWQVDVISRTRDLLPRMSFVVTTHNPLTLVGAKPEEIWILSLDGNRVRAERGTESPMLLTGGQIYSRYFGIHDIYPNDLGRKLSRYGFLSGYALRDDAEEAELVALRDELRKAGIEPGWEEVAREALPPLEEESPVTSPGLHASKPARRRAATPPQKSSAKKAGGKTA